MEALTQQQPWDQQDDTPIDMTSEFTCYLCNGYIACLGSLKVMEGGIRLCTCMGYQLELDQFEDILSVNEMEPINSHTLVITFMQRYVMVSHLLRKEKLVEVFNNIGLYKSEPRLPLESIGMTDPETFGKAKSDTDHSFSHMTHVHSHTAGSRSHMTSGYDNEGGHMTTGKDDEVEEAELWNNQHEQERHIQRQIRQQSVLNPIQMLSSIQQNRASEITNRGSLNNTTDTRDSDYKQLHNYPSSNNANPNMDNSKTAATGSSNYLNNPSRPAQPSPKLQHSIKNNTNVSYSNTSKPTTTNASSDTAGSTNLSNLKLLFPTHSEDQLRDILSQCGNNLDKAISAILGEDELANALNS